MAHGEHRYRVKVTWTGNRGSGTSAYRAYSREHTLAAAGKPAIPGSSDPAFRGDGTRWNPEDLLVASAAACHKLWYLHLCAEAGVTVLAYADEAEGLMLDTPGNGRFAEIVLHPRVTIRAGDDAEIARHLHHDAHRNCYVANSVNFPICCEPLIEHAAD